MSKLANQWIDVFAAGNYGDKGTFTEQDLQQIVGNYDPAHHEAPAVIGHPKNDAPAYGWVDKLRVAGKKLQVKLSHVNPAFEDLVESRSFPKRSVSLYKGDKGWSLRHVGFLGAQPPEIKGLADIRFEQEDEKAIAIDFAEESDMAGENKELEDSLFERLKGFFSAKQTEGVKTFSEQDVQRIVAEAVSAAVTPLDTRLKAQETSFSEREKALSTNETKQRAATALAGVKAKGAWVPAFDKMGVPVLFEELAKDTATVEFGEGSAAVKKTPLEILVSFMEGMGKIVPTDRVFSGEKAATSIDTGKINSHGRAPVDPNSAALDSAVRSRMSDKSLSYADALDQVSKEKPELTKPGGASGGAV